MKLLYNIRDLLRSRIRRLLERSYHSMVRPRTKPTEMDAECVRCGCRLAYIIDSPVTPDFELSRLPDDMCSAFTDHRDAICANCGLYHAYRRFNDAQIDMMNGIGKDALTTDEVYHSYPVPEEFIDSWYGNSVERQRNSWLPFVAEIGLVPNRVLVMRYWLGRQLPMLRDAFDAEFYGVDISPICTRHVAEHYPYVHQLDGAINGAFSGPFLDEPPFDLVIVQHVLVHSNDVTESIAQLRHLVRDGGLVIVSAETKVAPTNPFHKFYPTEYQTVSLLADSFDEVYKLDESGPMDPKLLHRYTGRAVEFAGRVYPENRARKGRMTRHE